MLKNYVIKQNMYWLGKTIGKYYMYAGADEVYSSAFFIFKGFISFLSLSKRFVVKH